VTVQIIDGKQTTADSVTVQIINGKHKRDESLVFFVLIFILYQNW
jgi:hypothetical protein